MSPTPAISSSHPSDPASYPLVPQGPARLQSNLKQLRITRSQAKHVSKSESHGNTFRQAQGKHTTWPVFGMSAREPNPCSLMAQSTYIMSPEVEVAVTSPSLRGQQPRKHQSTSKKGAAGDMKTPCKYITGARTLCTSVHAQGAPSFDAANAPKQSELCQPFPQRLARFSVTPGSPSVRFVKPFNCAMAGKHCISHLHHLVCNPRLLLQFQ